MNGLTTLVLGAAIGSLVIRFWRSRGMERQQLKWFAYAGMLVVLASLSTWVVPNLGNLPWVMVCALPVAVGIAVLRYRLYDIDLLINRTLVYGSLTAILGLGYVGVVLVLGQVFGGVGGNPPSWVVAGATLAAAALFRPARRRVQALVDRRFNRRMSQGPTRHLSPACKGCGNRRRTLCYRRSSCSALHRNCPQWLIGGCPIGHVTGTRRGGDQRL